MSVCPVVLKPFATFVFLLISNVGVQRRDAFIVFYPLVGSSQSYMSMSLSGWLSTSLFGDQSAQPVIACKACGSRAQVEITSEEV